jgi:hypothetical protein
MCQASAARRAFHRHLADAVKKPKVAIVAVMRKMIVTLNAILRDDAAWLNRANTDRHTVAAI